MAGADPTRITRWDAGSAGCCPGMTLTSAPCWIDACAKRGWDSASLTSALSRGKCNRISTTGFSLGGGNGTGSGCGTTTSGTWCETEGAAAGAGTGGAGNVDPPRAAVAMSISLAHASAVGPFGPTNLMQGRSSLSSYVAEQPPASRSSSETAGELATALENMYCSAINTRRCISSDSAGSRKAWNADPEAETGGSRNNRSLMSTTGDSMALPLTWSSTPKSSWICLCLQRCLPIMSPVMSFGNKIAKVPGKSLTARASDSVGTVSGLT
mmetsp:Transcript_31313/g.68626  ORF Transcript_31313/g.68626 Transcript_31313/m.68626 type:complete len:269 (-) Transcript_31313:179-985(-)